MEMREDPFMRTYKDDPRFIAIARKVGVMTETEAKAEITTASPTKP